MYIYLEIFDILNIVLWCIFISTYIVLQLTTCDNIWTHWWLWFSFYPNVSIFVCLTFNYRDATMSNHILSLKILLLIFFLQLNAIYIKKNTYLYFRIWQTIYRNEKRYITDWNTVTRFICELISQYRHKAWWSMYGSK